MRQLSLSFLGAAFLGLAAACSAPIEPEQTKVPVSLETLQAEFQNPPVTSRPRTWFHVMSGNMTEAGVTKDLESIADVGIGGVLLFNVTQGIPIGPVKFGSDDHYDLVRHMASESERLGLSFGVHNADGWTSSGGPWITPDKSMKKVVFSEIGSSGGPIDIVLPRPDALEDYYEDIATLAYPRLPSETVTSTNTPKVSASDPRLNIALITDGSVIGTTRLEATKAAPAYIQFEYAEPFPLAAIRFRFMNQRLGNTLLLASDDGREFRPVQRLSLRRPAKNDWGNDETLESPVTARYFRLQTEVPIDVQEVELSAVPMIGNRWGRTGSAQTMHPKLPPIGSAPDSEIIRSETIIDLSDNLDEEGRLEAVLPEGEWTIMRFGQTSTGARNLPASAEGLGLEVDKFSRDALRVHYEAYMGKIVAAVYDVAPNAHQYTIIDSYEVGAQNWTDGFDALFEEAKGYDLIPFLPLYAGRFVDSAEVSDRVSWDMRDVSNALMRDNYYGYFRELANADGLDVYVEPYGNGPFNELDAGGEADVPMGEFWVTRFGNRVNVAVSAAGIYGKPIASAESFTDIWDNNWKVHPAFVKTQGDMNWALGINEFMFHRFAHQANTHVMPGMTMNRWGSHFDRTQPWWQSAGRAWFEYLARGQHILRQGVPVNDALLFVGDGSPTSCSDKENTDIVPPSLNFLCLNADVLQTRLIAKDGAFELPEGTRFKFIVLQDSDVMSVETLEALDALSQFDGGYIIGAPPQHKAGNMQTEESRRTFKKRTMDVWSRDRVMTLGPERWDGVFEDISFRPDMLLRGQAENYFAHRKIGEHDIYFVFNETKQSKKIDAEFRVMGKAVSLWNPLDGTERGVESLSAHDDHTRVGFTLAPQESVFVIFDGDTAVSDTIVVTPPSGTFALKIDGPWQVTFDPKFGTDEMIDLPNLIDLKDHPDPDVRHYSGPIKYQTEFDLAAGVLEGANKIVLDLGNVQIAATVSLNGVELGTSWLGPHRIEVTEAIREGANTLTISVDNLWVNRLIGDAALPDVDGFTPDEWIPKTTMPDWYSQNEPPTLGDRVTFTTADFYEADDPLVPSGLIGPVTLISEILE